MSYSSLTVAAKSIQLIAGFWIVFMVSIGSCVQAQTKPINPNTPVIAGRQNIRHDAKGDVYNVAEKPAEFPGGMHKLYEYMGRNLHYPVKAREAQVQGKVFLTFIVEANGSLSDFKIVRGIGSGCDEEAIRVIKASPKWKPGVVKGQPVRQQFTMPVSFTLATK